VLIAILLKSARLLPDIKKLAPRQKRRNQCVRLNFWWNNNLHLMNPLMRNESVVHPTVLTFLLIEEFSAMCVVSAVDTLRAANRILGFEGYHWQFISHDGKPVRSSAGLAMEVEGSINEDFRTDFLFVCASMVHDPPYRQRLHSRLKHFDRMGVKLGSVSIGAFILARAGLLDGYRCTVHWEYEPAFREEFPDLEYRPALFVIDRNRYTGSGGIASMELILHLIEEDYGEEICLEVANNFHLDRIRNENDIQRSGSIARINTMPASIQSAVRIMLENTEIPLSNVEIAARINTSVRNLERMFKRNLKSSPAKYYLSLRLEKARELLMHTNLSTLEVALQTGFSSSSYFARCFQHEFGKRPSDVRKKSRIERFS
jgi:AraC family transcriptional regulator, glycine betaine-responsive activator